jgi:hypothetical protein
MTAGPDGAPDHVDGELEGSRAHAAFQGRLTVLEGRLQTNELDLILNAEVTGRVAHDDGDLLDHILATHPSYVGSMNLAEAEVAKGQRGRPLDEVIADLDSET